ncbi:hypothetical protein [Streptomyces sp. NPDC057115]|jgi:hypothetical protein|uniref:hypothetical protein n=1 Tax=unclassified Streptomyces TaxID=2593676 RepID=UPI0036364186
MTNLADRTYTAVIAERTVLITCPDNDHGGAVLPPDGWEDRAHEQHPTLHEVEGPTISGCYALRWRDDERSDAELLTASLALVNAAPASA